jgi:RNA polymerase-binding transcription factor DksA
MRSSSTVTAAQRRALESELRREHARLERTLGVPRSQDAAIGVMLESRTQARYDAVVAALARLETATYGVCVACARPIPFGRLVVMPEATHCVRCGAHE